MITGLCTAGLAVSLKEKSDMKLGQFSQNFLGKARSRGKYLWFSFMRLFFIR